LLSTFASLRWGEATALKRRDLDLTARVVRVRAAFSDCRSPGSKITLRPLKSRSGRRTVGIPAAIIPALRDHLAVFVGQDPDSLVFGGAGRKIPQLGRGSERRLASEVWLCSDGCEDDDVAECLELADVVAGLAAGVDLAVAATFAVSGAGETGSSWRGL
jgi:hypothetical protein